MPARNVALRLVAAVLDQRCSLTGALDNPAVRTPNHADRAFGYLIAATVLRRAGSIDLMLARFLERPLPRKAETIQHILRIGVAQIAYLGTAKHAVVNCAVEQAKARPGRFDQLVNAILRRVEPVEAGGGDDDPAVNAPPWLWGAWCGAYGETAASAIARAHLKEAPLDLSLHHPGATRQWADTLVGVSLAPGHVRLEGGGDAAALPGFEDGAWWVQDLAASLPGRALLAGMNDPKGRRIADLCAAPGGKTMQLAAAGADVTAIDNDADRLAVLRRNLGRLDLRARVKTADARTWEAPDGIPFDAVLLDAPCTATGTIRRHPDIPFLKQPGDVVAAAATQRDLLQAARRLVRPQGVVVYAVCSLQPEEGKRQIDRLVADGGVERLPIVAREIAGIAEPDADGDVQTLPSMAAAHGGMDGFFVARFRRTA